MSSGLAEYIWLDGAVPTKQLRSKTRIFATVGDQEPELSTFPDWSFDGSSTYQSQGGDSDLILRPVSFIHDPIRGIGNYLVMCEVLNSDNTPHVTNTRAGLRRVMEQGGKDHDPWMGFEQEYTLFRWGRLDRPLGWPDGGYPAPQGPFYCGVGASNVFGRDLVEYHKQLCLEANLMFYGSNAEVMPGQWEFQIGHRGIEGECADPLNVSDHVWFARWLLHRAGEEFDIVVSLDVKPVKGDWNGAGAHTNVSTTETRDNKTGVKAIEAAVEKLRQKHDEHIKVYGADLADRLTGLHETASINEFSAGVADRGASIRIPRSVNVNGGGYLEDRRPGANCDPYLVSMKLIETICC